MGSASDFPERGEGHAYGVPARRARILELLSDAYARDDLDELEFERRVERAHTARTIEELDALVSDFPEEIVNAGPALSPNSVGPKGLAPLSREEIDREIARLDDLEAPTRMSIIGDNRIALYPEDDRVVRSVSLIGDSRVDVRALAGQSGVVLVKVAAAIGDTCIVVPRGTPVDIRVVSLIGEQKKSRRSEGFMKRLGRKLGVVEEPEPQPGPPAPTVVVTGFKLIGDITIEEE
jgi:hypothetical protein